MCDESALAAPSRQSPFALAIASLGCSTSVSRNRSSRGERRLQRPLRNFRVRLLEDRRRRFDAGNSTSYAPPEAVWPWMAQMGPSPRGGGTYDWIRTAGAEHAHVDRVLPSFSARRSGTIGLGPNRMRLERVEPQRYFLAFRGRQLGLPVQSRERAGSTRPESQPLPTPDRRAVGMLPWSRSPWGRKMLRGIKERAEAIAAAA